ncbi:MAG: MATE family efflux transporter [Lachnospiraceae bacterium]|nr:MATE family efflux transporter [Lachnospiraceae bacterium]
MAATHMTEGNITKHLLSYSIPLILGNMFQLTYHAADSIIVGRLLGMEAVAAVGTAGPVMNILILGISGICIGSSVIMSSAFGAGDHEILKKELATTAVFGLYFSLLVAGLGILTAWPLLRALQVPRAILGTATAYLCIIFLGSPFTFFYNAVSAALKSIGDSKTPLLFLAFSSMLNVVLDILFIQVFCWGVHGSAAATVAAQAVSALLCILYVYCRVPLLKIRRRDFVIDGRLLSQTLCYGSVTALQQACQPIGKLLIQGAVNTIGIHAIAAFNAVGRIDDYACLPEQSIASGITTFTAQNRGAGKGERIRQGFRTGLCLEAGYWVLICAATWLLKQPIMSLFVPAEDQDVIALGCSYLSLMAFFYLFPAFTNGFQGFFRGMGDMGITLLGTFIQTSLRVLFVFLLIPRLGLNGVAIACAIGWSVMLMVEVPYFFHFRKRALPAVQQRSIMSASSDRQTPYI